MSTFRDIIRFCVSDGNLWKLSPIVLVSLFSHVTPDEDEHTISPFIYVQF